MSANAAIRPRARDLGIAIGPYNLGHDGKQVRAMMQNH